MAQVEQRLSLFARAFVAELGGEMEKKVQAMVRESLSILSPPTRASTSHY